jgi:hypothetical protein
VARYAGFPLECTSDASQGHLDRDNYTIRQWLGILGGNASTSIIDTSLYGDITIEITLAPSDVLMLSPVTWHARRAMPARAQSHARTRRATVTITPARTESHAGTRAVVLLHEQ